MPRWQVDPAHPNILVLYDLEAYEGLAAGEHTRLHSVLDIGVDGTRLGSHDYWIVLPWPALPSSFSAWFADDDTGARPRPFRGSIRMVDPIVPWSPAAVSGFVDTLAQEVAHYWLVRPTLHVGDSAVLGPVDFMRAVNSGGVIPDLCLVGREDRHWSSYLDADASPLDGVHWALEEAIPTEGDTLGAALWRYRQELAPGTEFEVPGAAVTAHAATGYSDLDLTVMGVLGAAEAYPDVGRRVSPRPEHTFEYVIPEWMDGDLTFHAGLVLVFDRNDVVFFGFTSGIGTLGVQRTGQEMSTYEIATIHRPWNGDERLLLRVVRRGDFYVFQARRGTASPGCLGSLLAAAGLYRPPAAIDPFDAVDSAEWWVTSPPRPEDWNTVCSMSIDASPAAVGYGVKTWGDRIPVVDLNVRALDVLEAGGARRSVFDLTPVRTGVDFSAVPREVFDFVRPKDGPEVVNGSGWHKLIVPPSVVRDSTLDHLGAYDTWTDVDNAPKFLTAAPQGDFAISGAVRLDRLVMVPWAGSADVGATLWGRRRVVAMTDLRLDEAATARRAFDGEPYRGAFVIVSPGTEDVSDEIVTSADRARAAWESYFTAATHGRRRFDTTLRS